MRPSRRTTAVGKLRTYSSENAPSEKPFSRVLRLSSHESDTRRSSAAIAGTPSGGTTSKVEPSRSWRFST